MSRVVVAMDMSVDGVVENPSWTAPFWNDDHARYQHGHLMESRALLLGRVTYQQLPRMWPARNVSDAFLARLDKIPKYVVSRTLDRPGWNTIVLDGDLTAQITKIKSEPGPDLLTYGGITLVNHLIAHNLVDELRLCIHPAVVGTGRRLFHAGVTPTIWRLSATQTFSSGAVVLAYRPSPA
ncbi:dihydrofolate reductase family protein [Nocardia crassostreae]|uniref:dihydrofolate reductase family protein n=1 Tax=Nocardia crassostreae TaxID=53428 RepID=UPI000831D886|nr:dihydrofolate reductase family protein [Nocardia crassostreae]